MSSITTESDTAPAVSRATALRLADGVIAGYIHSLVHASSEPSSAAGACLGRPALHARERRAGRASAHATRRPHARRHLAATA